MDHVIDEFDCGDAALNDWLTRRARNNQDGGASRTWERLIDDADAASPERRGGPGPPPRAAAETTLSAASGREVRIDAADAASP